MATNVQASAQLFYLNADTQAQFGVVNNGTAVFDGSTTNVSLTDNTSSGDWSDGQVVVGQLGTIDFQSSVVDATHLNYFVTAATSGGVGLSNLTATVYGSDGYDRPVPPIVFSIPDEDIGSLSNAATPVQVIASQPPNDGSSTLSPTVLEQFVAQDLTSAVRDLEARVLELNDGHPELVKDATATAKWAAGVDVTLTALKSLAKTVGSEFIAGALEVIIPLSGLVDVVELFGDWYVQNQLVDNVKQAIQRVENDLAIANQLAAKTFLPQRIEVSGTSDDFGFGLTAIGGPGQQYSNTFQFVGGGETDGTSTFSGEGSGLPVSGAIVTQNFYDSNGLPVYADSVLTLESGVTLFRKFLVTGPLFTNPDGSVTFDSEFQFSQELGPSGSLDQGLNGFQTTGDVSMTTGSDGRPGIVFQGNSPSSAVTAVTIPQDQSALAIDTSFLTDLPSFQNDTFSTDFTHDGLTTHLAVSHPFDPGREGSDVRREIVQIPPELQGQTGLLQFTFDPSLPTAGLNAPAAKTFGIQSPPTHGVILEGFDIVPIPSNTPPVLGPISDETIEEGGTLSFVASATDPNPAGSLAYSLDDAPAGALIDPVTGAFKWTATEESTTPVSVTVRVTDLGSPALTDAKTFSISVTDPSVRTAGIVVTGVEGSPFQGPVATFTDPGGPESPADYGATIDWGDGTTSGGSIGNPDANGVFTISGTHTYSEEGTYPVTVTVNHDQAPPVQTTTEATVGDDIGILVLDPRGEGRLSVDGHGAVTVTGSGAIIVDSSSPEAVSVDGHASVTAAELDVAGDTSIVGRAKIRGEINHEAPIGDPLEKLPAPILTMPAHPEVNASGHDVLTLSPGTYRGGISVKGHALVTLRPGVYVLDRGGLTVSGDGSLIGTGVMVFIAPNPGGECNDSERDQNPAIDISGRGSVTLSAPTSGPYHGVAVFVTHTAASTIDLSGDSRLHVTGLLYGQTAKVEVEGRGMVCDQADAGGTFHGGLIVGNVTITGHGSLIVNPDGACPQPDLNDGSIADHAPAWDAVTGGGSQAEIPRLSDQTELDGVPTGLAGNDSDGPTSGRKRKSDALTGGAVQRS